jgi:hypothetical protein
MTEVQENLKSFKLTLKDLKEKMHKMLKMLEGTNFKQNEALEILNDGLINIIDIKSLNRKIQTVKLIKF